MSWKCATAIVLLLLTINQATAAIDFDQRGTSDTRTFDQILQPVLKIYNMVKYVASAIAAIMLLFAGISYMTSSSDPKKRDNAKNMGSYVLIGLVIVWAAPLVVNYVTG